MEWIIDNILALIAILVSLGNLLVILYVLNNHQEKDTSEYDLSHEIIKRLKSPESRLYEEIENMIKRNNRKQVDCSTEISPELIKQITENVTNQVQSVVQLDLKEFKEQFYIAHENDDMPSITEETKSLEPLQSEPLQKYEVIYASAADDNTGEFYNVSDTYDDSETIFEVKRNGSNAEFWICKKSEKKVLDTPDYLFGACDVKVAGKSIVYTTQNGEAVLEGNKWRVIKKAMVKFE